MNFFATEALAFAPQAAAGGEQPGILAQMMPIILIFVIFWFLIIRPQAKKAKAHQKLVEALKVGDEVVTDSGIHGQVVKVGDDVITVEIAAKVQVKLDRARVGMVKGLEKAEDKDSKSEK